MNQTKQELSDVAYILVVVFLVVGSVVIPFVATGTPNATINWWGI